MKILNLDSISNKLSLLIIVAVLPALVILLYSGIEQRRQSIENTKREVMLLTHTMAETQNETTRATEQILSTLSRLPAIQEMDPRASSAILHSLIEQNTTYNNMALVDLNGDVLASGRPFSGTNLADRKHVREALEQKKFAVGEYIISRVGVKVPVFAFAYPVLSKEGLLKGVLTAVIRLDSFSSFHDFSNLPEKSFVALTDHKGIRLSYYPAQEGTNPIGKPIKSMNWEMASKTQEPGIFINRGSDGLRRIFAFEQVRLNNGGTPYVYVWAGIPETHILRPANAILVRNMLFMILVTIISLFLARMVGKRTIIAPAQRLVALTRRFAQGDFNSRSESTDKSGELGELTKAFHDMADTLKESQRTLRESESRYRKIYETISDCLFIADFEGNIMDANPAACQTYGYSLAEFKNLHAMALISPDSHHVFDDYLKNLKKTGVFSGETTDIRKDGSTISTEVRGSVVDYKGKKCLIALIRDVTLRKKAEKEQENLIKKLQKSFEEIKTLKGIIPICMHCKEIRDDQGYWNKIEKYITEHSEAQFSHGICDKCLKKHYPEMDIK